MWRPHVLLLQQLITWCLVFQLVAVLLWCWCVIWTCNHRVLLLLYCLQALSLSLHSCSLQTAATVRARQRLLQLVRSIILSEAACSTTASMAPITAEAAAADGADLGLQAPTPPYAKAASGAAAGAAIGSIKDNPLQDALAGVGWAHAARAPLVVAALKVLSALHGEEYRKEVLQLFPALCRLMCSNHLLTRLALHQVVCSKEFFELLPAARSDSCAQQQLEQQASFAFPLQQQQQQRQRRGDFQDVLL